jgi:nitroreductase
MTNKIILVLSVVLLCVAAAGTAFADVKLPDPRKDGGEGVFALIEKRASGTRGEFPKGAVSLDDLSTILWAGSGRNRNDGGWTIPLAGGRPPYVKIYALRSDGVFLYVPNEHVLREISDKNALSDVTGDGFVRDSSAVLIFVSDPSNLGNMANLNGGNALAFVAAGAMSQNIYLAADSLGVSARYMVSMKADAVKRELKLRDDETPLAIMPLGKR